MKQSTMKPQAAIREEELKNRIAALFFGKYRSVGPSMYCVKGESEKTLHGSERGH